MENDALEFKSRLTDDEKCLEREVVAFLNTKGGEIHYGVEDNGSVIGIDDVDDVQTKISNRIRDNIKPDTAGLIDVCLVGKDAKNLIVVKVKPGLQLPYYIAKYGRCSKGCFCRLGAATQSMTDDAIERMFNSPKGLVINRFSEFIDDYENWERVKGSQDTYYYTKDPNFRVIRYPVEEQNFRYIDDMPNYSWLLNDFVICKDYWDFHKTSDSTYEDFIKWFNVELFVNNTLVGKFAIVKFYSKYYSLGLDKVVPAGGEIYLPLSYALRDCKYQKDERGNIDYSKEKISKNDAIAQSIINSLDFKICRMLYRKEYRYDSDIDAPYRSKYLFGNNYERVLEYVNLEYLTNPNYNKENKDYINEIVITTTMDSRDWVKDYKKRNLPK
jgi:hypothetical protein